jgi:cysteine synthase A
LNVECHERATGAELVRQLRGRRLDAFVAGVGTGGTLVGVGRALRAVYPAVRLVAVEPSESAVMSGGGAGEHGISGIGDGFVPALASDGGDGLHPSIDEVVLVSTADAVAAAQDLAQRHGFCVGISSGANFRAASALAARGLAVATVFADGFTKYRSRGLEACEKGRCPFEHELELPGLSAEGSARVHCRSLG